jgi:hypothetical protein
VCVSVKRAWGCLACARHTDAPDHALSIAFRCIPQGDPQLDPTGTGTKVLPFTRSAFVRSVDGRDTREHINTITHFLDASMVSAFRLGTTSQRVPSSCHPDCELQFSLGGKWGSLTNYNPQASSCFRFCCIMPPD